MTTSVLPARTFPSFSDWQRPALTAPSRHAPPSGSLSLGSPATVACRDTAFAVRVHPDGGWVLRHFAAAVADHVPQSSEEDLRAFRLRETRLRATTTVPLLHASTAFGAALTGGAPRSALQIVVRFTQDGEAISTQIGRAAAILSPSKTLTYREADHALASSEHPDHQHLRATAALASALLTRRQAHGDVPVGSTPSETGGFVGELPLWARHTSYVVGTELAIAVNSAVAAYAAREAVPVLFFNHVTGPACRGTGGLGGFSPLPRGHQALGVPAYCLTASPLHRYADLVSQRQLLAYLDGTTPPLDTPALADVAEALNTGDGGEAARRRRQGFKNWDRQATHAALQRRQYRDIGARRWRKILCAAAATDAAPPRELLDEILARLSHDDLSVGDVAAIALAPHPTWRALRSRVYSRLAERTPAASASIATIVTQATGVPFDVVVVGESASPGSADAAVTAIASYGGVAGPVARGRSARAARYAALWAALETIGR